MIKRFLPAFACATLIFYLSTMGKINVPERLMDFFSMDKLGHFIAYGVFTISLLYGWNAAESKSRKKGVRMALIISILYGISIEVIQFTFFPGRYFENLDILANIIGSFTGLFLFNFFNKKS